MAKRSFPIVLIIICLVVVLVAGLFAADKMGALDIKSLAASALSDVPVISDKLNVDVDENRVNIPQVSPLEEENKLLQLKITDLENKVLNIEKEKTASILQVEAMQQELLELRNYKQTNDKRNIEAQELAAYYKEMKPEAVVKVMDKLDDDTILLILPLLDNEQAAKILSLMDSQRAALITQLLLGNNPAIEG